MLLPRAGFALRCRANAKFPGIACLAAVKAGKPVAGASVGVAVSPNPLDDRRIAAQIGCGLDSEVNISVIRATGGACVSC